MDLSNARDSSFNLIINKLEESPRLLANYCDMIMKKEVGNNE